MPSADPVLDPLTDVDWYRLVRSQIEFEASLVAQRLSWFVAAQSFLFTAYAIALNAPSEPAIPSFADQQRLLFHLVPLVAIASCGLLYLAIVGAIRAQVQLRRFVAQRIPRERLVLYPAIQGARMNHFLGLAAPLGLPVVFVAVWTMLFARGLS